MNITENKKETLLAEEKKEFDRHKITADQMPRMKEPIVQIGRAHV